MELPGKTKSKKFGRHKHLLDDPLVSEWIAGLKKWTVYGYLREFDNFLKSVGKTPGQILAERKEDLKKEDEEAKHRYEKITIEFFRHRKKETGGASGLKAVAALRSFFDFHYVPLKLRRPDRREMGDVTPVYVDYAPSREDLKAMVEAADARDRALILALASTGISGDICELKREQFESKWGKEDPVSLAPKGGFLYRSKTKVRMRPFLTRDAAQAIRVYLKTRRDKSPWLFVEKGGKQLNPDAVNKVVQRLARRATIPIPQGQRIRMHCFRKFFKDACDYADITPDWIKVMYGHGIPGSGEFYTIATEERMREKFRKVEPHLSVSRLSNMVILRGQHQRALDEQTKMTITLMRQVLGEEKLKDAAAYLLSMQPMIKWDPEQEYEPAVYRWQRALREVLGKRKKRAPRKRKRGA